MRNNLNRISKRLSELEDTSEIIKYHIPSLWSNPYDKTPHDILVNPREFFIEQIEKIKQHEDKEIRNSGKICVYNMLIRYTTAYDHDNDGEIRAGEHRGFRETGTFLKAIALLPYIKSLGCNAVYLLPVTSIGKVGRKGNLGSPYAIANPYELDENLGEPILEMSIEEQFASFVEAAHLMGMKVITEFVFRTASIDSPLAIEHPEWFYWIRADVKDRKGYTNDKNKYGPPYFNSKTLEKIYSKIENNDRINLPAPDKNYKDLFTDTPNRIVVEDGKIFGYTRENIKCKIPSAFADWPPDDNQPVWSDVTYLKMYDDRKFNYVAYNTIRMYDKELAVNKNRVEELWEHIIGIIPYHQKTFDIDGVMIDMGHALPEVLLDSVIKTAREVNPDFILWEENFQLSAKSKEKGFDASLGYLPFDSHIPEKMNSFIRLLSSGTSPIQCFLTPETHNTKRAAARQDGIDFSKNIYAINSFLDGILFIHSGFELAERRPVNTGLQFSDLEIAENPADTLPLFSTSCLNWNNTGNILSDMRKINDIRESLSKVGNIKSINSINPRIISFVINTTESGEYLITAAPRSSTDVNTILFFDEGYSSLTDFISGVEYQITNNELLLVIKSYQVIIGKIK